MERESRQPLVARLGSLSATTTRIPPSVSLATPPSVVDPRSHLIIPSIVYDCCLPCRRSRLDSNSTYLVSSTGQSRQRQSTRVRCSVILPSKASHRQAYPKSHYHIIASCHKTLRLPNRRCRDGDLSRYTPPHHSTYYFHGYSKPLNSAYSYLRNWSPTPAECYQPVLSRPRFETFPLRYLTYLTIIL